MNFSLRSAASERMMHLWKSFDFIYNLTPKAKQDREEVIEGRSIINEYLIQPRIDEMKQGKWNIESYENGIPFLSRCFQLVTEGVFTMEDLCEEVETILVTVREIFVFIR